MATRRPTVQVGGSPRALPAGDRLPADALPDRITTHTVLVSGATVSLVRDINIIEVFFDGAGTVTVTAAAGVNAMYEVVRAGGTPGTITVTQA